MNVHDALEPPLDVGALEKLVPEISLARSLEGSPFHHLDTFDHVLEVIRGIDRELDEERVGAYVRDERVEGLRLAGLLHDVAKPVTRGEAEGRVLFVAHDSLGARLVYRICRRLHISAGPADAVATLTALHLKIGFMAHDRSDYPPERLVRSAGPFGEELAVLSWADRLAARGPRLTEEHIERHRALCKEFLQVSRRLGPHDEPDYPGLAERLGLSMEDGAEVGYAASRIRLLWARGLGADEALRRVARAV